MLEGVLDKWQSMRTSVRGFDTSRQLAMGVAIGMMIGLVPKDSVFVYLFALVLLLSTSNLLTGLISTFCFSWIAPLLDPITNSIGHFFLTIEGLGQAFARLNEIPLIPWTRFENTVVTGSVLLGLILLLPTYAISKQIFERYGKSLAKAFLRSSIGRWLAGVPAQNVEQA